MNHTLIICFSAKLDRINEILNTDQPSAGRKYGLGKYQKLWSIEYSRTYFKSSDSTIWA